MVRALIVALFGAVAVAAGLASADESQAMLCTDSPAGTVAAMPAPFDQWVTVLCAPDGQALAAEFGETGAVWMRHGTQQPFMLKAVPEQVPDRQSFADTYGRHQIRFLTFMGSERTGQTRQGLLQLYQQIISDAEPAQIDAVYQLDTRSVYNLTDYSLFFYVAAGRPRHVIICAQACRSYVALDVVSLSES